MKLLVTTQILDLDDPILGFFHQWVEGFARSCEAVTVICLKEGRHNLPSNVRVLSLGKESHVSRAQYIFKFYRYIWRERHRYDAVFVHMNQIYVLLGGLLWRMWGKQVGLWYVHRSVTLSLRAAVVLVHVIFTTSPESFRIATRKRLCIGHGIDMRQFVPRPPTLARGLQVLTAGRISATKRIREMIDAVALMRDRGIDAELTIAGTSVTPQECAYEEGLPDYLFVHKIGSVIHANMPELLATKAVFLNLSATESMDKAVLEALAVGVPVVTSNGAFREMLAPYNLFVSEVSPAIVARALEHAHTVDISDLSHKVRIEHSLERLVEKIVEVLQVRV